MAILSPLILFWSNRFYSFSSVGLPIWLSRDLLPTVQTQDNSLQAIGLAICYAERLLN